MQDMGFPPNWKDSDIWKITKMLYEEYYGMKIDNPPAFS